MTAAPIDSGPSGSGKAIREDLEEFLGIHAHVKVVHDKRTNQQRIIVYCIACRSASMVSYHRHEIVALWDDHVAAERHRRKAAVAEARAANHEGLFPEDRHAAHKAGNAAVRAATTTAVVFAPPLGDSE